MSGVIVMNAFKTFPGVGSVRFTGEMTGNGEKHTAICDCVATRPQGRKERNQIDRRYKSNKFNRDYVVDVSGLTLRKQGGHSLSRFVEGTEERAICVIWSSD